ncbi:MAG: hypothetical protein QXV17_14350 [Candidatus Micrarchaeaceae archaeon]
MDKNPQDGDENMEFRNLKSDLVKKESIDLEIEKYVEADEGSLYNGYLFTKQGVYMISSKILDRQLKQLEKLNMLSGRHTIRKKRSKSGLEYFTIF